MTSAASSSMRLTTTQDRTSSTCVLPTTSARPSSPPNGRDRGRPRLFQGPEELPAGLLTAAAGLLANPAVRVHLGMPLALVAAALADGHAGLQQGPGDVGVVGRRAAHDPDGGGADIGAVQAEPDACDHLGHVLLAQVGVDVGGAGLGTVAERIDGGGQHLGIGAGGGRVGVQQLPGVAHGPSSDGDAANSSLVPTAAAGATRRTSPNG